MPKNIGILTAGGDSPGLNAAIRGIGKTARSNFGMRVIGFKDGFRGLVENRFVELDHAALSGILTRGGTILGTSRDKPHKMQVDGKTRDMTDVIAKNYAEHELDCLICLGGGGTLKNAYRLHKKGLNVIHLPKTIDNDVWGTDRTFGFDTALGIATEAIDRLHTTAHSHHRIIVVEIMGHNTGWLALGAGVAGGADVILIPEVPYRMETIVNKIQQRVERGTIFSIVAVSEGAMSQEIAPLFHAAEARKKTAKLEGDKADRKAASAELDRVEQMRKGHTLRISQELEQLTGLESRVTILGHVQRGGTPSPADRILASKLGSAAAVAVQEGQFGIMVASDGFEAKHIPMHDAVGKRKTVPLDHEWIHMARRLGLCLGD